MDTQTTTLVTNYGNLVVSTDGQSLYLALQGNERRTIPLGEGFTPLKEPADKPERFHPAGEGREPGPSPVPAGNEPRAGFSKAPEPSKPGAKSGMINSNDLDRRKP